MQIFEQVVTQNMIDIFPLLTTLKDDFYLGGGTALALQIGHRQSIDLDFFSLNEFDTEEITTTLNPTIIESTYKNTLHCSINNVRLTFLYYPVALVYPTIKWRELKIAHANDVIAEKFKTVSQRGAKKDFCDLYAVFQNYLTIEQGCKIFIHRFSTTGINFYAVLKSLTSFTDADQDPEPLWSNVKYSTKWDDIKTFFTKYARDFAKHLIT